MMLNHYRNGTGEPLVLIHGIGSRWQMWEPVLDRLVAHRDVIALDLPGFGGSEMPPAGTPAGPASLTSLVSEFLGEIGVERPHVAGNSLGGLIALELARRSKVRSANGISPAGFANRRESALSRSLLWGGVRAARRLAPRADALMGPPAARILAVGQYVAHPTRMTPADAAANLRALAAAPWFDETLPTIGDGHFGDGTGIRVPVTITWGDRDRVLPPRQLWRAAKAIPQARFVPLPSCGHLPTYDDPELVARVMLEASAPSPWRPAAAGR
jgi:pimeloyl-ACP methyl ester carboxylesterase